MKLIAPHITIQNTDGLDWMVTAQDLILASNGLETVSFTVLVPKSQKNLPAVTCEAVQKTIALLQGYLGNPDQ